MTNADLNLDRVSVGVTIESTILTPEHISERVGVDPRGHTGKQWECNVWRIFVRKQGAVNTSAHDLLPGCVADVVNRLTPISEKLRDISEVEGGEFFIHVTAQSVPGISLSRDTLRTLANARLSLDIDIVPYASEEN